MKKKCAIIGGGLAGMAAAIRIANSGHYDVDLFEQTDRVGGKLGSIHAEGFRFDTGPTLITLDFVLRDFFKSAGACMENYFRLLPLERSCTYHFHDLSVFRAYMKQELFDAEASSFVPGIAERFREYFAYCKRIYDLTADIFIFSSFHEFKLIDASRARRVLDDPGGLDPFRTMHAANASFFTDRRIVRMLDRYATFNGSSPYKTPATLNVIQHVEHEGAFVPNRGVRAIADAFRDLALEKGVRIHTSTEVERILTKDRRVRGIVANGERFAADIVVSNCDVRTTYERLLRNPLSPDALKYAMLEPSSSALVFFWGVEIQSALDIHNILFSRNYRREFVEIFSRKRCPSDPTIYIHISSKYNRGDAPAGCENWYVMINAPRDAGQDWRGEIDRTRERIIDTIEKRLGVDLRSRLRVERVLAPPDIERTTGSLFGSLYGPSSNGKLAAFLRQANRSRRYPGLYFAGGSGHPGGGIPLVVLSGSMTADLVARFER